MERGLKGSCNTAIQNGSRKEKERETSCSKRTFDLHFSSIDFCTSENKNDACRVSVSVRVCCTRPWSNDDRDVNNVAIFTNETKATFTKKRKKYIHTEDII
jgi:hypothetical protein